MRTLKRLPPGGIALITVVAALVGLSCVTSLAIRNADGQPLPEEAASPTPVTLRVASFNAWLLPIGAADATERRQRLGPAIDALEPDVVCLQEVWTRSALDPIAEALAHRLPAVATGGGGLVVLSRWPIRDASFQAFPGRTAPSVTEWLARKGWLSTLIETPAGPLRVVNSHLALDLHGDREGHTRQLSLLLEALRQPTDVPTILCADLNLRAQRGGVPTEGFSALLDAGFEDAASPGAPSGRQGTRVGWPRAGRTARWDPDYVMFRSGDGGALSVTAFRQTLDTVETALSDHNLQLADFEFTPR